MAVTFKTCPQCGNRFAMTPGQTTCSQCGHIFTHATEKPTIISNQVLALLLDSAKTPSGYALKARAVLLFFIILLTVVFLFSDNIASESFAHIFFHNVNLPFHEAGHIIFSIFATPLITSAGGTLMQLLMPLICSITLLLKTRDPFGASVAFWWIAQNFIDSAPYINDARAGVLPLLGGNTGSDAPYGFHDWEFILGELKLLQYDHLFATISIVVGLAGMILSIVWGCAVLWRLHTLNKYN
jgi:hypothetical protein